MRYRSRDESAKFTVAQVNEEFLDPLAAAFDTNEKLTVVKKVLPGLSMKELKWFTRIILKDMKLGIGHETILKNYHAHALDIFNATSDLKSVFTQVDEYEQITKSGKPTVYKLFLPIKPMLAGKAPDLGTLAETVRAKGRVLVETKFDGERIQCHFQDGHVMFFSRNGKDYTKLYSP